MRTFCKFKRHEVILILYFNLQWLDKIPVFTSSGSLQTELFQACRFGLQFYMDTPLPPHNIRLQWTNVD